MRNRRETGQGRTATEPLCGWAWVVQHRNDHTFEEIESLSIQLSFDGKALPEVRAGNGKGIVKDIVKELR